MNDNVNLVRHAAVIAAAYVAHNELPVSDLPEVIRSIHRELALQASAARAEKIQRPAAPMRGFTWLDFTTDFDNGDWSQAPASS